MSRIQISDFVVATQARAMRTRGGQWVLVCDLEPAPGRGPRPTTAKGTARPAPVHVKKLFGNGETAGYACRTRAHQMSPGVRVSVSAPGATGRIVLDGVTDLTLPDLYDHHHKVSP